MLRAVPSGRSFFGWGTTTVIAPFLNLWCDPLMLTNSKPSALRRLTMSRLLRSILNYMHTDPRGTPSVWFAAANRRRLCGVAGVSSMSLAASVAAVSPSSRFRPVGWHRNGEGIWLPI